MDPLLSIDLSRAPETSLATGCSTGDCDWKEAVEVQSMADMTEGCRVLQLRRSQIRNGEVTTAARQFVSPRRLCRGEARCLLRGLILRPLGPNH